MVLIHRKISQIIVKSTKCLCSNLEKTGPWQEKGRLQKAKHLQKSLHPKRKGKEPNQKKTLHVLNGSNENLNLKLIYKQIIKMFPIVKVCIAYE